MRAAIGTTDETLAMAAAFDSLAEPIMASMKEPWHDVVVMSRNLVASAPPEIQRGEWWARFEDMRDLIERGIPVSTQKVKEAVDVLERLNAMRDRDMRRQEKANALVRGQISRARVEDFVKSLVAVVTIWVRDKDGRAAIKKVIEDFLAEEGA